MRVAAIVAARMDSSRLPGKPLLPVHGTPLIQRVLQRAGRVPGVSTVVLATTERSVDDTLATFAKKNGYQVYRGPLDDVAARFLGCARSVDAGYFVRVNGDSPFLDPRLVADGIELCFARSTDFATNLIGRTFPYGVSVEIINTSAYAQVYERLSNASDREHVTTYLYRHPDQFTVAKMVSERPDLRTARLVIDTREDAICMERLFAHLGSASESAAYTEVAEALLAHNGFQS